MKNISKAKNIPPLLQVREEILVCKKCPKMIGPPVSGPPIVSSIYLLGQAPGPKEGVFGKPFAWTAGKTLFKWLFKSLGASEEEVRERIYFAAVARCFPGKNLKGGGDRKPDEKESLECGRFIEKEISLLKPKLLLPVGTLAISEVFGEEKKLVDVVGKVHSVRFKGHQTDVIALPHPSGLSTWYRTSPGQALLEEALILLKKHPASMEMFFNGAVSSPVKT